MTNKEVLRTSDLATRAFWARLLPGYRTARPTNPAALDNVLVKLELVLGSGDIADLSGHNVNRALDSLAEALAALRAEMPLDAGRLPRSLA